MKKKFFIVAREMVKRADVVLEILDARMPEFTRNKEMEEYAKKLNRPLILVMNKSDLVARETLENIKKNYEKEDCVFVSSKKSQGIGELITKIKERSKGRSTRIAFIGYPNTGKSSLINRLSKKGRAKTSSESGFTKGLQLIAGKMGLRLFDTPGVIPLGEKDEVRLGLFSGISPSKLEDPEIVAYELINMFKKNNPSVLRRVYGIGMEQDAVEIIHEFGNKRHMFKKGRIVDERRASIQIITDWHKGKIRL